MITVTRTKKNGIAESNLKRGVNGADIFNLRPSTEGNLATAAIFEVNLPSGVETWYVSETYTQVLDAVTADTLEAGAEVVTNKATDFSTLNDTLYPTTDAVGDSFQPIWYAANTGTDTYAITLTGVVPTAYYAGMNIRTTFANANTGAATINVNALGAKAIAKNISTALAANDIAVGKVYELVYDGTRFQIVGVDKAPIDAPTFTGVPAAPTAASGTNTTQIATTAFVQNKKAPLGTATGTDTYAVTLAPVITVATGALICVRFTNASSGASTLNVAAGGAVAIVKKDGSTAIGAGDIAANTWYQLLHDGTSWVALGI